MRTLTLKTLFLFIVLFGSHNLLAKQYQIELIIFEHIYNTSSPEADTRVSEDIDYSLLRSLSPADKESLVLSEEAKRVRGSRNFRFIAHAAWVQEGLSREEAGYVSLNDWLGSSGINGTATVYINRYLHLDVQLNKESNNALMNQKRRMRSKELHYIDHPNFGILAQITPLE